MPLAEYALLQVAKFGPTASLRRSALGRLATVELGEEVYVGPGITLTPTGGSPDGRTLVSIGDRVAVSPNVSFICSAHPEASRLRQIYGGIDRIEVGDDAWIGADVTILGGVTIGPRSVVAAGATVVDDVPSDTVVGGVPATELKSVELPRRSSGD